MTGDIVVIQDADLEYDPSDYMPLLAALKTGSDAVYGSRVLGQIRATGWSLTPGKTETWRFTGSSLELVRPIVFQGTLIGTVDIRSDLKEIYDRLLRYAGIVALVLLIAYPAELHYAREFFIREPETLDWIDGFQIISYIVSASVVIWVMAQLKRPAAIRRSPEAGEEVSSSLR